MPTPRTVTATQCSWPNWSEVVNSYWKVNAPFVTFRWENSTRGWGAPYNLSPPQKMRFLWSKPMKTGIFMIKLYENWDVSNLMKAGIFFHINLWPGFLNQRTRVGGCYFQQTNRKRSKKAGDLGIVTFFQWLFQRFYHHTYRVHVRYIFTYTFTKRFS